MPPAGQYLVLVPGEKVQVTDGPQHRGGHAIVVGGGELAMVDGMHRSRCRIPASRIGGDQKLPLAVKIALVFIHYRPVGPIDKGNQLVYALNSADEVIGSIDASDTWHMRSDCVEQICRATGLEYEVKSFERVDEMLTARPKWAYPSLEFETAHPQQEAVREWAMGIGYGSALALGFGGVGMLAVIQSPIGFWYRATGISALVLMMVLTLWSRSRRRMRRSMKKVGVAARVSRLTGDSRRRSGS